MKQPTPLLAVRDLGISFRADKHGGEEAFAAVKGISFDIPENTTVALVGESGSGKSVTSLSILGLLPPENARLAPASRILYAGRDLLGLPQSELRQLRGRDISMIFQEPMSSLNPVFTVGGQVAEVLRLHLGLTRRQAQVRVLELLSEVGIADPLAKSRAYPFELSGGQQQRVMIAIAIACNPRLVIADEPTTALDVTIQKQILELLVSLQEKHGMSVLFITHDLAVVGEIADRVVVMKNGEIREQGTTDEVFNRCCDSYTRALLLCRPPLAHRPRRLAVIEDFMGAGSAPPEPGERERGLDGSEPVILEVSGLGKSFYSRQGLFGRREFKAVQDVSFKLARGKTLGVVGESGSGKTTVGLTLMRLHEASTGVALFEGRDILSMSRAEFMPYKRRIQIVFQNPYASLNPRFTVGQILSEPMLIHGIGASDAERAGLVRQILARVELPAAAYHRYPHEFSGGQRQRIAIARCLTMKPDVLICDESVSALDVSVQAQMLNLLQDLQDEFGLSYIFISHDLAVVRYMSDQVMVMNEGRVVEFANSDDIYLRPQHPYTQKLLAAVPSADHRLRPART